MLLKLRFKLKFIVFIIVSVLYYKYRLKPYLDNNGYEESHEMKISEKLKKYEREIEWRKYDRKRIDEMIVNKDRLDGLKSNKDGFIFSSYSEEAEKILEGVKRDVKMSVGGKEESEEMREILELESDEVTVID